MSSKIVVEHTFGPKGFIRNIAKPLWNLPTHYLHLLQLKKRKSTCSILKTIINMNESQTHQNHHQQPTYVQTPTHLCPNTQRHTYNYQLKCCSKHLTTPIQCKPTTNNHNKYTGKTKQKLQRKKNPQIGIAFSITIGFVGERNCQEILIKTETAKRRMTILRQKHSLNLSLFVLN